MVKKMSMPFSSLVLQLIYCHIFIVTLLYTIIQYTDMHIIQYKQNLNNILVIDNVMQLTKIVYKSSYCTQCLYVFFTQFIATCVDMFVHINGIPL